MSDEGFLSRWSRRKRAALVPRPEPAPATVPAAPQEAPVPAEALAWFDPASLPAVESLTAESDITVFLRPQVPEALRNAALRRVWSLDPAIRDYVGPADYAWDYNAPDGMAGFSLELGGDVKRLLAQAIGLTEEPEAPKAEPEPAAAPPEALPEPAPEPEPVLAEAAPEPEPVLAEAAPVRRHGGAVPV